MKTVSTPALQVSVVIMTFNRPTTLRRCLESMEIQSLDRSCFEILVVDVSTEPVTNVLRAFEGSMNIRHFHTANRGVAGNRNFGADRARAALLAYIDDDCVAEPSWLEKLVSSAEANPGCLIGGGVRNLHPGNVVACAGQVITEAVDSCFNTTAGSPVFFPGLNFAVPRDRYLSIGGCDEAFGRLAAEDRDFADRWNQSGGQQVSEPDAIVIHEHRTDLKGFIRQYFNYGKGAWRYHSLRRSRNSSAFSDSLGLHTRLWSYTRQPLSEVPSSMRTKVYFLLLAWEMANAAGFAWQACKESVSGLFGPAKQ